MPNTRIQKLQSKKESSQRDEASLLKAFTQVLPKGSQSDAGKIDRELEKLAKELGDQVYADFLRLNFHIELEEAYAKDHWVRMLSYHEEFQKKLGEDVDFRISAMDYLMREAKLLSNPTIVEAKEYVGIHQATFTDTMTGLYNLRYFRRIFEQEIARASRYSLQCSLIFFDIDHFKNINDQFGHLVGDEVLQEVANMITGSVRSMDIPCRYGGEEFVVITPQTSLAGALLLAERIRANIASMPHSREGEHFPQVTISGGVASFPEDANSADDLLNKADKALYLAKDGGRNRVEVYRADQHKKPKLSVRVPVLVSLPIGKQELLETKNVSEGGISLEMSGPLVVGSVMQMEVRLDGVGRPVKCVGSVTHLERKEKTGSYEVEISIVQISQKDYGRYRKFITTRASDRSLLN